MPDNLPGQPVSAIAEENRVHDSTRIRKYLLAVLLTPLFAGLASFGAESFPAFLRTLIFFSGIALFLPVANRLIRSERKYKTFLILGGAFLAGMIACALAFPLTTSIIPRTCPIHYLLSGGVYLILFYGVYLLYVRYCFHWSFLFIYLTPAGMAGYIFHQIPIFNSLETFITVCLASILNALTMSFFLTVLFTRLNPLPRPPSKGKSGFASSGIRIVFYVLLCVGSYISMIANGMIKHEERIFMVSHFSDPFVIKDLSGQLEIGQTALRFTPGMKPEKFKLQGEENNKVSPDGQITIQDAKNNNRQMIFLYKGKKIHIIESACGRGFWDRNRYLFPHSNDFWEELIFHGDAPPTVRTFKVQGAALVPDTDAVFYCLNHEFYLKEGNSEPRKIYSAKPFIEKFSTNFFPAGTAFTPGFKHIFYICRHPQFLAIPTRIIFVFEPATNRVYIYDRFGEHRDNSPIQWREKK